MLEAHRTNRLKTWLDKKSEDNLRAILKQWDVLARPSQWPPETAPDGTPWSTWLFLGGRGAGKTYAGAQWVKGLALGLPGFAAKPIRRIALIGETAADVRDVMIEGVSGILSVHTDAERPLWEPTRKRLTWPNGAVAQAFSAEDPESLRGPQFEAAWCDELAKWRYAQATWDMLQFGLRLGTQPRQLVTTTPRATPLVKALLNDPRTAITRATTRSNARNLAPSFLNQIVSTYAGTRLGRQELDGELVEDRHDALWQRGPLETRRVKAAPDLERIVVAIDPPASSHKRADKCGIVAAGITSDGLIYVLADESCAAVRPGEWARVALALYHRLDADALVAEVNQGGEMVEAVIAEADASVPVTMVRATRGKYLRAAPVAQLYEQGRVHHAGAFPALEDEMCGFGPSGLEGGRSPDRLDALVWAITALALTPTAPKPRMRRI